VGGRSGKGSPVNNIEQDVLMSPNPSGKLEDLVVVVCVCLVV